MYCRQTEERQTKSEGHVEQQKEVKTVSASHLSRRRQESQQGLASVHSLEDWSMVGNFLCNKTPLKLTVSSVLQLQFGAV